MQSFKNKVVWVTGASSGIGEALAKDFARKGAKVILTARRKDRLEQVAQQIHHELGRQDIAKVLPLDLLLYEQVQNAVEQAIALFGGVDVLVNNAGASQRSLVVDTPFCVEKKMIDLDLMSPIALTKAILPHFLSRKTGRVIVTSSVMGYLELPGNATYACVKHGLNGYFYSLGYELKKYGILVQVLEPGFVKTEITLNAITASGVPYGKMDNTHARAMSAEEFSRRAIKKLEQNSEEIIIAGKEIIALYVRCWFPSLYRKFVHRFAFRIFKDRF